MQRTQQVFLLCLCALVAGVAFAPSQANALDLQIPVQLGFSYDSDTYKNPDAANEPETTLSMFEFSGQLPIIFKFHPKFGVGPAFRFESFSVSTEVSGTASGKSTNSHYFIGLGLMLRSDVHEMFAIQAAGYYDLGKSSSDSGAGTTSNPDGDLSGFEFRLDLLGRAKVGQYKTWFELGPYFYYRSYTDEKTVGGATVKEDHSGFGLGLALQGTFEFGI